MHASSIYTRGTRFTSKGMVCVVENSEALCVVRDLSTRSDGTTNTTTTFKVPGSTTVRDFVHQVANQFKYQPQDIELVLSSVSGEIVLKESSNETLQSSGIRTEKDSRNSFLLQPLQGAESPRKVQVARTKESNAPEEELNLGASASPTTTGDYPTYHIPAPSSLQSNQEYPYTAALIKQDTGYVGLVNQAMTCYLNSLLQALFMTPEFRNALYKWQYNPSVDSNPAKCIPYQLQRLFLNLQTSKKAAVETTELTRSFGWDSSEAWQQHDIQELCRVMFDALEHVFKETKQADLIDRLYQGKMIDYVKCLECSKEKSREDTFLDIPLPVRPFGSTVAYGSVEEALRAFVQPETLDGANQYFCEACAKKCDAHKGLKFTKFPYLLTLHLKRFDFDYNTMHRIKLNDKVTFPEILDLNSFVEKLQEKEEGSEGLPDELTVNKCDDSSTTDSGSALDDESCHGNVDLNSAQDINQEDDEGIDVSGGNGHNHHENEKNRRHGLHKGPYLYELFSIMIHSGSASGGHYYAYIKDFSNGEWFCFNDTSVSRITNDDIAKTYGGGALRGYYSGAYSSSTNAYMLMYRQISDENCDAIKVEEFPTHIKELYDELQKKQETDRKLKERQSGMTKLKVYCQHPSKGISYCNSSMQNVKVYVHTDSTLSEVTSQALDALKLTGVVAQSDCRLVSYNPQQEGTEVSFDGREQDFLSEINLVHEDMFLEIKNPDESFQAYQPGGLTIKAFIVDLEKDEVEVPPISIRSSLSSTVGDLKDSIGSHISIKPSNMVVVMEKYSNELQIMEDETATLKQMGPYTPNKVYICSGPVEKPFKDSKLHTLIDRFEHVITLHLTLPDTDPDTLTRMAIPSLSAVQAAPAKQAGDSNTTAIEKVTAEPSVINKSCGSRGLMLPLILTGGGDEESGGVNSGGAGGGHSDQSASEDSSLTDSDRTLIGDVHDDCLSDGDNQLASPPEEEPNPVPAPEEETWDEEPINQPPPKQYTYFRASAYQSDSKKMLKVQVDKRMPIEVLKVCLEQHVGVPASCFKLYRNVGQTEYETQRPRQCDTLSSLKNEDSLLIKLGRQLSSDEHKIKVHQLVLNSTPPIKFLCEWIVAKGGLVGQSKKEIIDDLNKRNNMNIEYDKCRLRKKNWKNVGKVYLDNLTWVDDVTVYTNGDIFLQELSEPETMTSSSQLNLLVRHWHPSTLTLDPFHEIVLNSFSIEELKETLSQKSGIPVENVDFAKPNGFFPCDMSVLSVHTELEWNPKATSLEGWPIQITEDGGVIFYRDSREELKPLSEEERKELTTKETARLSGSSGTVSTYSPRKERPLKIYLERRPCATGDTDVD